MSPRDALKHITPSWTSLQRGLSPRRDDLNDPQSKLEAIAAEIAAIPTELPTEEPEAYVRTAPRRDIAEGPRWFILTDAMALAVGFITSWLTAILGNILFLERVPSFLAFGSVFSRSLPFGLIALGVLLWFGHKGHYRMRQPFWMEAQQIAKTFAFAIMVDGFFHFAAKQDFSRLWLMSGWIFAGLNVLLFRSLMRVALRKLGWWQIRTLLVGSGPIAEEARAALRSEKTLGYEIVMQIENVLILLQGAGQSWRKLCDRFNADYVVIAMDGSALAEAETALSRLSREGIPYSLTPPFRRLPVFGVEPHYFINHDILLMVPTSNLELPLARFLKRSLDIFVSGTALTVLSPLLLALAFLIRRDGGPALFGHKRLGLYGRNFDCLKFRSMAVDSEERLKKHLEDNPAAREEWQQDQKLRDDPRVTKLGGFLRRTSLDELPQLINVLRGDMSLVGPRPIVVAEAPRYHHDLAHYLRVRPGITGLWQVSGRNNVSYARRVQMDSWYVRNWSLWHDIAILFKTVPAILKKTGAY